MTTQKPFVLLDPALLRPAVAAAFAKLSPRVQWRNPVMFVVYIGSILTTLLGLQALQAPGEAPAGFIFAVALWLWFTVLFANFAEALAEGRSKAQAASLRSLKKSTWAKKLKEPKQGSTWLPEEAENLRKGDVVLIEAGDMVPLDGEVIEGVASVDESAITGESAPVVRESGGDFSSVTGGTRVLSDWLVVRISVNPGEAFLDRMISMVEGAKRAKTPNEIALTIVFLIVTVTLLPFSIFSVAASGSAIRAAQPALDGRTVQTDVPPDLPLVEFDAVLMARVLVNLLENAAKYGAPPLEVLARVTPDSLVLTLRDHGPGLPPALRGREAELFEKFTRGQSESATPGVGLGLAICKAIVDAHRGKIVAGNAPGGGAEFTVTLPRSVPPEQAPE